MHTKIGHSTNTKAQTIKSPLTPQKCTDLDYFLIKFRRLKEKSLGKMCYSVSVHVLAHISVDSAELYSEVNIPPNIFGLTAFQD